MVILFYYSLTKLLHHDKCLTIYFSTFSVICECTIHFGVRRICKNLLFMCDISGMHIILIALYIIFIAPYIILIAPYSLPNKIFKRALQK